MSSTYVRITKSDHPNARKDGRLKRSRFVMSKHLGRPLKINEHIHHINGDKTDDRIENLRILNPSEHISLHVTGEKHPMYKKDRTKVCPNCKKEFFRQNGNHFARRKFCSKKCAYQYLSGEKHHQAKITQEIANQIKTLKGILPSRKIALKFDISPTQVKRILRGESWA